MGYTVVLPTLNENDHINKLIKDIQIVFSEIDQDYEIIVVDDNSNDGTIDRIKEIKKDNNNIQLYVRKGLKKNLANSINLGIKKSKFENIIWMDADFQHPPDHIKLFHNKQKKYDVVIFSRFIKGSTRYFDEDISKKEINEDHSIFFNKLCKFFLYEDITDYTSGFICSKKKIFTDYKLYGYYGEYFIDLIVHCKLNNYSIIELPFKERERCSGSSKTFMSYSPSYVILFYNYFLGLLKNYFRKKFKIY
jgi:dolichol-phosphate mannosyltransferase|tara:strand:- start:3539 stop:4285 length:747 start_codon:yes stop_codon:yes gene_type:complete